MKDMGIKCPLHNQGLHLKPASAKKFLQKNKLRLSEDRNKASVA